MSVHSVFRMDQLITLGALFLFALVELFIAVWLTAKYNANDNFPTSETPSRVRYLLFMSIWIIVFGIVYLVGFFVAENSILASVGSSFVFLVLTWILWLAAAAAITQTLGGKLNCSVQTHVVYCGQLSALEGFAWLIWLLLTLMLVFVLIRSIQSAREGGLVVEA